MTADSTTSTSSERRPPTAGAVETPVVPCTMREFLLYFLRLGTFGFGGPIALAGYMQKDLVEERRWISKQDYLEGLALAQLMPGPLAAQLAMYLGWIRARVLGATLVAFCFVFPSWLMVLALSFLYVRYGGLAWMQGAFYGIGAAVIAIIARSAVKLVKMTVQKDRLLWGIFLVMMAVTAFTASEIVWLFLGCGVLALLVRAPPRIRPRAPAAAVVPAWLLTGLGGIASLGGVATLFLYFAEAGAFVFGSGLAIIPFLHGGVVDKYHWLTERQFVDAVAVAMITPGPVVITVARLFRHIHQLLRQHAAPAHGHRFRRVADKAVVNDAHVQTDNIAKHQMPLARQAVHHLLVDGNADVARIFAVAEERAFCPIMPDS